jgi:hypothetical protein
VGGCVGGVAMAVGVGDVVWASSRWVGDGTPQFLFTAKIYKMLASHGIVIVDLVDNVNYPYFYITSYFARILPQLRKLGQPCQEYLGFGI